MSFFQLFCQKDEVFINLVNCNFANLEYSYLALAKRVFCYNCFRILAEGFTECNCQSIC